MVVPVQVNFQDLLKNLKKQMIPLHTAHQLTCKNSLSFFITIIAKIFKLVLAFMGMFATSICKSFSFLRDHNDTESCFHILAFLYIKYKAIGTKNQQAHPGAK